MSTKSENILASASCSFSFLLLLKRIHPGEDLAAVAQWTECCLANPKIAGSIPSQGTCLGCGPGPQKAVRERQSHIDVSLPFFLSSFPSV